MNNNKVLKVRKYNAGYEVRTELVDGKEFGGEDFEMRVAYTLNGDYIGDPKRAYRLMTKHGIKSETVNSEHSVCSIGFCEKEQKWYGWSHRAMYGFGIGSTCEIGDCHFNPSNKEEFLQSLKNWYSDDMYENLKFEEVENGVKITYGITPNGTRGQLLHDSIEEYPSKWGKGCWTAKTLDDAKQMAIDFAEGVS
jgi:hypothetical protein